MTASSLTPPATGLRERNRRRRVAQILEATRSLLRERPYQSPSVERIAARAEVAPATIFNLIGPREQIWAALADDLLADLERRTNDLGSGDPHSEARAIAATTVDIICADADVYRHVLANWNSSGQLLRRDPTRQLVDCLQRAASTGTLRDDLDLKALGEAITTACTGAAHQWAAELIRQPRVASAMPNRRRPRVRRRGRIGKRRSRLPSRAQITPAKLTR